MEDKNGHPLVVGDYILYGGEYSKRTLSLIVSINNDTLYFKKDDFWKDCDFSTSSVYWEYVSPDDALLWKLSE
jgi:hypothetical protein